MQMRAFVVLCLLAVACADKLGYNYQPVGHSSSGLSFTPGGGSGGADYGSASSDFPSYSSPQGQVEKEFYSFTADENDFIQPAASNQYENSAKQGLRVIFIKGPENNGLEDAALAFAKQAASQKTAIYVLNKQPDLNEFSNKLNQVADSSNNKPEVHFVKYRTPEDAANAQRSIQGQYDSLGGPSQHFNGGVAPALNYASSSPVGSYASGSHPAGSYASGSHPSSQYLAPSSGFGPSQSYLPASLRRRFRLK